MAGFEGRYRRAFSSLGRPLGRRDATPYGELLAVEKALGVRVPLALHEYYRVAGRANDFNCAHDRLLAPTDWSIDSRKLIFMEENQAVVLYGTIASSESEADPPAFMGMNDETGTWSKVNAECSTFLVTTLHWQAAFGGAMPYCGSAEVPQTLKKRLEQEWSFVGEVNEMRAYNKPGQAVCLLKWDSAWRVFVGVTGASELDALASELNLRWDGSAAA